MTLSLSALSKFAGPVLAAAVGAGAAIATGNHSLEAKVDQLVKDMGAVKCKLNIENTCPPEKR